MPVTHQEIAEKAGVSRALVTRALHRTRHARVSEETRREILRVAHQLGYEPRNFTTRTVAYVTKGKSLGSGMAGSFLNRVEAALQANGYRLAIATVWDDNIEPLRDMLTPKSVDGVILTESFGGRIRQVLSPKVPFVLTADEDHVPDDVDLVTIDTVGTLEKLTRYLLQYGHTQLCLISVSAQTSISVYKYMEQGIRRELMRAGLPQENLHVLHTGPLPVLPHGSLAGQIIQGVQEAPVCTAVIAADLHRALPGITALYAGGFRIPQDISFVSVFDSEHFLETAPPCTATTAYGRTVAERAVKRLLEKIEDPGTPPHHERIVGNIIERQSVGAPFGV